MRALLLALALHGGMACDGCCVDSAAPVLVVVQDSDRKDQTIETVTRELKASLGSCSEIHLAEFDAEPALQTSDTLKHAREDFFTLRPRTPMREAMEVALVKLKGLPRPHTLVVAAHDEFCPTAISEDHLLKLARSSETVIHAIHVTRTRRKQGRLRSLGRPLLRGLSWIVEAVVLEERAFSPGSTTRFLKAIVEATGGQTCVACDEASAAACAKAIAREIAP